MTLRTMSWISIDFLLHLGLSVSLSLSLSFYFQVSSLGRPTYTWLHQPIPTNQWLFKASQFLWRPIPLPTPNKAVSNILPQTLPTYGFHVPFIVSQKVVFFFFWLRILSPWPRDDSQS